MKTKIIVAIIALLALPEFAAAQPAPVPAVGSNFASSSSWLAVPGGL